MGCGSTSGRGGSMGGGEDLDPMAREDFLSSCLEIDIFRRSIGIRWSRCFVYYSVFD